MRLFYEGVLLVNGGILIHMENVLLVATKCNKILTIRSKVSTVYYFESLIRVISLSQVEDEQRSTLDLGSPNFTWKGFRL